MIVGSAEPTKCLRTTAEDVWALGDIVRKNLPKRVANREAHTVVRDRLGGESRPLDYTVMPFTVFASLGVAGVGVREQELEEAEQAYATRTCQYEMTPLLAHKRSIAVYSL